MRKLQLSALSFMLALSNIAMAQSSPNAASEETARRAAAQLPAGSPGATAAGASTGTGVAAGTGTAAGASTAAALAGGIISSTTLAAIAGIAAIAAVASGGGGSTTGTTP